MPYIDGLRQSVEAIHSRPSPELTFNEAAARLWEKEYDQTRLLRDRSNSRIQALTSRAAPIVCRLAVILTVLTQSPKIQESHLLQALRLWQYVEDSIEYIFGGGGTGNREADRLLGALTEAGKAGMSRTDISNLFNRHKNRDQLNVILSVLKKAERATFTKEGNSERWFVVDRE